MDRDNHHQGGRGRAQKRVVRRRNPNSLYLTIRALIDKIENPVQRFRHEFLLSQLSSLFFQANDASHSCNSPDMSVTMLQDLKIDDHQQRVTAKFELSVTNVPETESHVSAPCTMIGLTPPAGDSVSTNTTRLSGSQDNDATENDDNGRHHNLIPTEADDHISIKSDVEPETPEGQGISDLTEAAVPDILDNATHDSIVNSGDRKMTGIDDRTAGIPFTVEQCVSALDIDHTGDHARVTQQHNQDHVLHTGNTSLTSNIDSRDEQSNETHERQIDVNNNRCNKKTEPNNNKKEPVNHENNVKPGVPRNQDISVDDNSCWDIKHRSSDVNNNTDGHNHENLSNLKNSLPDHNKSSSKHRQGENKSNIRHNRTEHNACNKNSINDKNNEKKALELSDHDNTRNCRSNYNNTRQGTEHSNRKHMEGSDIEKASDVGQGNDYTEENRLSEHLAESSPTRNQTESRLPVRFTIKVAALNEFFKEKVKTDESNELRIFKESKSIDNFKENCPKEVLKEQNASEKSEKHRSSKHSLKYNKKQRLCENSDENQSNNNSGAKMLCENSNEHTVDDQEKKLMCNNEKLIPIEIPQKYVQSEEKRQHDQCNSKGHGQHENSVASNESTTNEENHIQSVISEERRKSETYKKIRQSDNSKEHKKHDTSKGHSQPENSKASSQVTASEEKHMQRVIKDRRERDHSKNSRRSNNSKECGKRDMSKDSSRQSDKSKEHRKTDMSKDSRQLENTKGTIHSLTSEECVQSVISKEHGERDTKECRQSNMSKEKRQTDQSKECEQTDANKENRQIQKHRHKGTLKEHRHRKTSEECRKRTHSKYSKQNSKEHRNSDTSKEDVQSDSSREVRERRSRDISKECVNSLTLNNTFKENKNHDHKSNDTAKEKGPRDHAKTTKVNSQEMRTEDNSNQTIATFVGEPLSRYRIPRLSDKHMRYDVIKDRKSVGENNASSGAAEYMACRTNAKQCKESENTLGNEQNRQGEHEMVGKINSDSKSKERSKCIPKQIRSTDGRTKETRIRHGITEANIGDSHNEQITPFQSNTEKNKLSKYNKNVQHSHSNDKKCKASKNDHKENNRLIKIASWTEQTVRQDYNSDTQHIYSDYSTGDAAVKRVKLKSSKSRTSPTKCVHRRSYSCEDHRNQATSTRQKLQIDDKTTKDNSCNTNKERTTAKRNSFSTSSDRVSYESQIQGKSGIRTLNKTSSISIIENINDGFDNQRNSTESQTKRLSERTKRFVKRRRRHTYSDNLDSFIEHDSYDRDIDGVFDGSDIEPDEREQYFLRKRDKEQGFYSEDEFFPSSEEERNKESDNDLCNHGFSLRVNLKKLNTEVNEVVKVSDIHNSNVQNSRNTEQVKDCDSMSLQTKSAEAQLSYNSHDSGSRIGCDRDSLKRRCFGLDSSDEEMVLPKRTLVEIKRETENHDDRDNVDVDSDDSGYRKLKQWSSRTDVAISNRRNKTPSNWNHPPQYEDTVLEKDRNNNTHNVKQECRTCESSAKIKEISQRQTEALCVIDLTDESEMVSCNSEIESIANGVLEVLERGDNQETIGSYSRENSQNTDSSEARHYEKYGKTQKTKTVENDNREAVYSKPPGDSDNSKHSLDSDKSKDKKTGIKSLPSSRTRKDKSNDKMEKRKIKRKQHRNKNVQTDCHIIATRHVANNDDDDDDDDDDSDDCIMMVNDDFQHNMEYSNSDTDSINTGKQTDSGDGTDFDDDSCTGRETDIDDVNYKGFDLCTDTDTLNDSGSDNGYSDYSSYSQGTEDGF